MRKLTKEEFINREPDLLNGEYEFVGEYKGANIKTLFKHSVCGYEWMITPSNFQRGRRCSQCARNTKLTKEQFCEREGAIQSGEYEFIGEYVGTHSKALFKHNECDYEWMVSPNSFHRGSRCPKCALKRVASKNALSKEEFITRELDLLSGEYELTGEYITTNIKTLFRHNVCGYEWETKPHLFHRGHRCPKCANFRRSKKRRLTKDEFCKREEDILSGEYEFAGEYINTNTKTLFKHTRCGYTWEISPSNFHRGTRCPKCAIQIISFTKREFCERESDISSGDYVMLGEYKNSNTKTLFKHNKCGYEWMARPNSFYKGTRCPKCATVIRGKKRRLTKEEFVEREEDIQSGEYEMLGKYTNITTKTLFKHTSCGHEWSITPDKFHWGVRCPKCNESRGEKSITNILEEMNIPFESQKRFDSCRHKLPLPFDFYVNDSFLIEYDGEQHFKPTDFAGKGNEWADKSFKSGQLRDSIKTQWAKNNGIPLVRIPYTEFDNIEQIIKDSIEKYSTQKVG